VLCMGLTCTGFALARSFVADPLAPPHAYGWLVSIDQICFLQQRNTSPKRPLHLACHTYYDPVPSVRLHISSSRVLAPYLFPRLTIAYLMLLILALWLF